MWRTHNYSRWTFAFVVQRPQSPTTPRCDTKASGFELQPSSRASIVCHNDRRQLKAKFSFVSNIPSLVSLVICDTIGYFIFLDGLFYNLGFYFWRAMVFRCLIQDSILKRLLFWLFQEFYNELFIFTSPFKVCLFYLFYC